MVAFTRHLEESQQNRMFPCSNNTQVGGSRFLGQVNITWDPESFYHFTLLFSIWGFILELKVTAPAPHFMSTFQRWRGKHILFFERQHSEVTYIISVDFIWAKFLSRGRAHLQGWLENVFIWVSKCPAKIYTLMEEGEKVIRHLHCYNKNIVKWVACKQ